MSISITLKCSEKREKSRRIGQKTGSNIIQGAEDHARPQMH